MMVKRRRPDDGEEDTQRSDPKKARTGPRHHLLDISDELLLRVLSFLTVKELVVAESICRRFRRLATDQELWKSKYYDTWIRSRVRRLPSRPGTTSLSLRYAAKAAKWLEHGQHLRDGTSVDWKRQYKIRSNWAIGAASVHEVEVASPPSPPAVARVHRGVIFTVDAVAGLRAWLQKDGGRQLKAQMAVRSAGTASCLAVDTTDGETDVVVGFQDGSFHVYAFEHSEVFRLRSRHVSMDESSPLTCVAIAMPHVMTMSQTNTIRLYHLTIDRSAPDQAAVPLATLQSDTSFAPVSLALRRAPATIIATVAYAFRRLHAGWCLGLQEVRMSASGTLLDSRLTSTIETPLESRYLRQTSSGRERWDISSRSASSLPIALHPQLMSPPTSISYDHPYLICSLADNTVMCYLVTSNVTSLEISTGRRLWGHTSAVSGAEVNNRGKAVSISSRGDEIRVWELEDVMTTINNRKTSTEIKPVRAFSAVTAALARRGQGLGLAVHELKRELALTRRWVGFDDEQVVVLGDRDHKQIMSCYDFT